jgi:hypothetical protein
MKIKTLTIYAVMLSYLMALLIFLTSPAIGEGCGTNPLGDTSGDTDFYVSKNQNLATSSGTSTELSQTGKAPVALGSTAAKASQKIVIQRLYPDKPGPQSPGTSVIWIADVANPDNEELLFDFLLKGPSTDGQQKDETRWTTGNTWTWNVTDADIGETLVEVQVKGAGSNSIKDSKTQSYVIVAETKNGEMAAADTTPVSTSNSASNTASETASSESVDTHPESRSSDINMNNPRLAPDEKPWTAPQTPGPNMEMPNTEPKPLVQDDTETPEVQVAAQAQPETEEPQIMQVDGKWTVKLENAKSSMDLILIQTGERVQGSGSLNEATTKIPIIAKGSVSANSITLDVQTVVGKYVNKIDKSFYLDLVKVDRVISGSYEAYSGEDLTGKGNVTASRFAS